jgi:hypothetical protein
MRRIRKHTPIKNLLDASSNLKDFTSKFPEIIKDIDDTIKDIAIEVKQEITHDVNVIDTVDKIVLTLMTLLVPKAYNETKANIDKWEKVLFTTPEKLAERIIEVGENLGLLKNTEKLKQALAKAIATPLYQSGEITDDAALATIIIAVPILEHGALFSVKFLTQVLLMVYGAGEKSLMFLSTFIFDLIQIIAKILNKTVDSLLPTLIASSVTLVLQLVVNFLASLASTASLGVLAPIVSVLTTLINSIGSTVVTSVTNLLFGIVSNVASSIGGITTETIQKILQGILDAGYKVGEGTLNFAETIIELLIQFGDSSGIFDFLIFLVVDSSLDLTQGLTETIFDKALELFKTRQK